MLTCETVSTEPRRVEQFLKPLPANKRQIRPTKFQDFTAKNITDRQATLNFRPFLVLHLSLIHI